MLLRRLAAGERSNEAVDWPNVIEEVEAVGWSELHACESLIEQALAHLAKLCTDPRRPAAPHWRGETVAFLARARRVFTPSMRRLLDVASLYDDVRRAADAADAAAGHRGASGLMVTCPFTLDDVLADTIDLDSLAAKLEGSARQG